MQSILTIGLRSERNETMATIPFDKLPVRIRQIQRGFRRGATRIVQEAASVGHSAIVLGTPVDTGAARSNHVVTLGSPFAGIIPPYAPGKKLGIGEAGNAQAAIAQGQSVIQQFDVGRSSGIISANNLNYIGKLNAGSSAQAPAGFAARAAQAAIVHVKSIKKVIVE